MDVKQLTNEEKLNEIYEMVHENHKVLRSLRSQQYFSNIVRVVYWLVILGVIGGAYYYVQPIIGAFSKNSANVDQTFVQLNQIKNQLPETKIVNQLIDWLKNSHSKDSN